MSTSKRFNSFIALHAHGVSRGLALFYMAWFALGMFLVDIIDPYLFIGLWMPIGAMGALICYKW